MSLKTWGAGFPGEIPKFARTNFAPPRPKTLWPWGPLLTLVLLEISVWRPLILGLFMSQHMFQDQLCRQWTLISWGPRVNAARAATSLLQIQDKELLLGSTWRSSTKERVSEDTRENQKSLSWDLGEKRCVGQRWSTICLVKRRGDRHNAFLGTNRITATGPRLLSLGHLCHSWAVDRRFLQKTKSDRWPSET